jgi:hypothetical protein
VTKHSPGPWHWVHFMETLSDAEGKRVMTFMPYADKGWTCETDARLIAAAPELLDVLKKILALASCPAMDDLAAEAAALVERIER